MTGALPPDSRRQSPSLFLGLDEDPARECDNVASAALEHVGKRYRITRELASGLIDCSTLVSQSHWIGAAIQTPFIAESQRTASNGFDLAPIDELLPGDLLFAYPSRKESPGGRHNHVGMYVGEDAEGTHWVIESRDPFGVIFTPLERFTNDGGRRRYAPNPRERFCAGIWSALAPRVPKLGRLGARLTAHYSSADRHTGIDAYLPVGTPVVSPTDGIIAAMEPLRDGADRVTIVGPDGLINVLAPISSQVRQGLGDQIRRGDSLGATTHFSVPLLCNATPHRLGPGNARLHWEVWSPGGPSPAPDLRLQAVAAVGDTCEHRAQSALYLVKTGRLTAPVDPGQAPG